MHDNVHNRRFIFTQRETAFFWGFWPTSNHSTMFYLFLQLGIFILKWLKIQGFFQSGEGTWLEFLWGGGTKLELRYWVRIVIINQIPPGGGTANLKSRNLSRKKVSCTTILQSTGRGNSTGITIPKASRSGFCENHGAGELRWNPRGGGTQLELLSLRLPGRRSVRTTGRGNWDGIHWAGALNWNYLP